ncbi:MAG: Rieske 2Fe-2S domain-containing protein [Bacteroidetes bacterium]|nr:Rieske 2Fe-2S domain-containing protein [Bacteroidota bacterium]
MVTVKWIKIAESREELHFSADGTAHAEADGKKLCIISYKEELYACVSKCPHAGGMMADGYIDAVGNIVCPVHRYKFDLRTGRNISGEGYYLKTYPIEERQEGIFVGIKTGGLFGG